MKYKLNYLTNNIFDYYLVINVYNEGGNLHKFLKLIPNKKTYGVIIADSPSDDGSTSLDKLLNFNVDILLSMKSRSDHSKTLLSVTDYLVKTNFKGMIIVDGNGKDYPSFTDDFIKKLEEGYDYIQGSRFLKKGMSINTPLSRTFLIRYVHAPLMTLACRKQLTDTTNGFRAISSKFIKSNYNFILNQNLQFYEFYFYTCFLASRRKYKIIEIPVKREYQVGKLVSKINSFKLYWSMLKPPLFQALGIKYKF
jgi:dolichol-phosphate mannosyltransferase